MASNTISKMKLFILFNAVVMQISEMVEEGCGFFKIVNLWCGYAI